MAPPPSANGSWPNGTMRGKACRARKGCCRAGGGKAGCLVAGAGLDRVRVPALVSRRWLCIRPGGLGPGTWACRPAAVVIAAGAPLAAWAGPGVVAPRKPGIRQLLADRYRIRPARLALSLRHRD